MLSIEDDDQKHLLELPDGPIVLDMGQVNAAAQLLLEHVANSADYSDIMAWVSAALIRQPRIYQECLAGAFAKKYGVWLFGHCPRDETQHQATWLSFAINCAQHCIEVSAGEQCFS